MALLDSLHRYSDSYKLDTLKRGPVDGLTKSLGRDGYEFMGTAARSEGPKSETDTCEGPQRLIRDGT